jgi:D-alanyl-D-alanine carboxypeptidase/D-alanyl-D-alanine-endopeptidase (penicillin-binding protein 4)
MRSGGHGPGARGRGLLAGALLMATAFLSPPESKAASLSERVEKLLAISATTRQAFWGIQIVDVASGQTLYELNPERFFVPASNTKLFTTALALTRLGPDFTFQTRVLADSAVDAEGRIHGSLVLAGGGDPNLSGRAIPYRMGSPAGNPLAALDDLADQVAARGVKRVDGDIVGDDTWYVWEPYSEGWAVDDLQYDYGAAVSALTLNDNTLAVTVQPGERAGDLATVALEPPVEVYTIENRIRTVEGGVRKIDFERAADGSQVRIWGSIPLRDRGETLLLGVADPARYAALAFRQALEERGIVVHGGAIARHLYRDQTTDLLQAPSAAGLSGVELARRTSAPLIEDLRVTDKISQNLHAEMALRAVGRARRNVGSMEAGLEELRAFLSEAGIEPASWNINDGSGLARLNLVTPSATVKLLRFMMAAPVHDAWLSLLPVAGRDGTLSARFGDSPAAGRIYAKTGTVSHVSALSGYAKRPDGTWVAFSILANNYNGPTSEIRGVMDSICALLVE